MKPSVLALIVTLAFVSVSMAAPAAPTITVAASNIKQLQFDITPVSAINRYELWFKASSGTPWVLYAQTPPQRPRFRINVSVHLLDWQQARFHVKHATPALAASRMKSVSTVSSSRRWATSNRRPPSHANTSECNSR